MPNEIETKFKVESPGLIRKRLKKIGAKFVSKKLEKDTYYCNPTGSCSYVTIRLRELGKNGVFTIKGPSQKDKSNKYKIREELQAEISDVKAFSDILKHIGFMPRFQKEKIRETYKLKNSLIAIDKLPFIGFYAEIEASKVNIKKIAKLLGFDMEKAIPDTYMELFRYYKMLRKKPCIRFLFKSKR